MRIRTEVSRKNWACVFGVTLLTFASLLGLQLAKAQTATGTIVGTVTDPKGLPIVEVSVVVRNQDTETESIFPTNAAGIYVAPYLQPGDYQVTASKSGFEIVVHKNVVVHVGDRLTIDVQLSLQTQQTSIIVTEEAPVPRWLARASCSSVLVSTSEKARARLLRVSKPETNLLPRRGSQIRLPMVDAIRGNWSVYSWS